MSWVHVGTSTGSSLPAPRHPCDAHVTSHRLRRWQQGRGVVDGVGARGGGCWPGQGAPVRPRPHAPSPGPGPQSKRARGSRSVGKRAGGGWQRWGNCLKKKAPTGYHRLELSMRGKADIKVKVNQSAGSKAPTTHQALLLYRIRARLEAALR